MVFCRAQKAKAASATVKKLAATRPAPEWNGFAGEELDDNFLDDVDAAFLDKDDSLSPVLKDDGGKNKLDFMQSNILNFDDVNVEEKPA